MGFSVFSRHDDAGNPVPMENLASNESSNYHSFVSGEDLKYGVDVYPENKEDERAQGLGVQQIYSSTDASQPPGRNNDSLVKRVRRATRNRLGTSKEDYLESQQEAGYDSLEESENDNESGRQNRPMEAHQPSIRLAISIWKWEILALFVSIACMAAVVGILAGMKDQLSTAWRVGLVTINAAVTALSTIASIGISVAVPACLDQEKWQYFKRGRRQLRDFSLFDQAARGLFGAFKILWLVRWGTAILASCIIILDLASGFMIQQAVKLETGYEWVDNTDVQAFFPYTQNYDTTGTYDMYDAVSTVDFSLQAAVFRGLSDTSWPRSYTCGSNCTWPDSQTVLGFTSTCANVTDQIANFSQILRANWEGASTLYLNLTTPGGVELKYSYFRGAGSGKMTVAALNVATLDANASTSVNGSFMRVALFRSDQFDTLDKQSGVTTPPVEASVLECTLSLTAWNYSAITSDDNLNIGSREPIPLLGGNYSEDSFDGTTATPTYINYTAAGSTFSVNMDNIWRLQEFLASSAFVGTVSGGIASVSDTSYGSVPAFVNQSFADVMDRVSLSMTDSLQEGKNSLLAYGLTQVSVNHIRVYWEWICLPVAVEIFAVLLLVCTIVRSSRTSSVGQVPMWKSSRTALLFHHLNNEGDMLCELQGPKQLKIMEKKIVTKLGY